MQGHSHSAHIALAQNTPRATAQQEHACTQHPTKRDTGGWAHAHTLATRSTAKQGHACTKHSIECGARDVWHL
eukprot:1157152-Pelagomonas_calceolata.AAC.3